MIDGLKRGDFGLHQGYIESLSSVDPAVGHSSTVEAIFMLTKQMTDVITAMRSFQSSPLMHFDERMYITAVTGNLLQKSAADIEDLTLFVRSGEAAMSEENRMQHIGALYTAAKDRHAFLLHFRQGIQLLQRSRAKEKQGISDMNTLYGIK